MGAFLVRVVIALVVFGFLSLLIPMILTFLGLPIAGGLWQIIRLCMAAFALVYICFGSGWHAPYPWRA